jgi:hypothetical protein
MATSMRSAPGPNGRRLPRRDPGAPLGTPLLILNLKAYPEGVGERALALGRLLQRLGARSGVPTALAASAADLGALAGRLSIPILAQHADDVPPGPRTGWMVPSALEAAGVKGSLLGHSEHPLPDRELPGTVRRLRACGLASVVCAGEDREAILRARRCHPDYLAVEGGTSPSRPRARRSSPGRSAASGVPAGRPGSFAVPVSTGERMYAAPWSSVRRGCCSPAR